MYFLNSTNKYRLIPVASISSLTEKPVSTHIELFGTNDLFQGFRRYSNHTIAVTIASGFLIFGYDKASSSSTFTSWQFPRSSHIFQTVFFSKEFNLEGWLNASTSQLISLDWPINNGGQKDADKVMYSLQTYNWNSRLFGQPLNRSSRNNLTVFLCVSFLYCQISSNRDWSPTNQRYSLDRTTC